MQNEILNASDEAIERLTPEQENELASEYKEESLTDWANPPTVKDLKQDYTDATSDHDGHVADVDGWLDNLNIDGNAKPKKVKGKSNVQPMTIRKQAEWRYASLTEPFLSTDDVFNTAPVTYEDKEAAIQNGLVLNNQFNTKINKIAFFDEFVRTVVDEGTGFARTGWAYEEEIIQVPDMQPMPIEDPMQAQQIMQMMQQAQQMMQAQDQEGMQAMAEQVGPEMMKAMQLSMQAGIPMAMVQVGMKDEVKIVKNHPTVEVCDYNNILVDPTCMGDLDKAEFIIYSFETNLSALEKDGKYSNLGAINIEENNILGDPDHQASDESSFNFSDKPRKKFVAYEYWGYWDFNDTGIVEPFVATWVGSTMIRLEENPFPDKKLPFVSAQYLPVRRSIYGQPDGYLLEDNQRIIGAVTRGMIDIMARSANGQQGTRQDALDVTNKRKFDRGDDYEFNAAVDPKQAFHMHTYPEIPQSAPGMIEMQNNEAESLTGVKAFSQGISGQALGATATGIRSALDATSKRELGILRRIAEAVKQIGRKFTSMNAEFLNEEEIIRITNDEFVPVRRDNLNGDIDIELTISTAEADNDKAEQMAFMLQTTGQTMGPQFSQLILENIARLRKMPDLAKAIKDFTPPEPDPMEVQLKQLELKKLEMEIAKLQSETVENQANAMLDQAKAGESQAKTRLMGSDADQKDLNFVEQESGIKQQRDLELQGEQARGNMKLKAMENSTKLQQEFIKADAAKAKAQSSESKL